MRAVSPARLPLGSVADTKWNVFARWPPDRRPLASAKRSVTQRTHAHSRRPFDPAPSCLILAAVWMVCLCDLELIDQTTRNKHTQRSAAFTEQAGPHYEVFGFILFFWLQCAALHILSCILIVLQIENWILRGANFQTCKIQHDWIVCNITNFIFYYSV